jgi:hypothetical protein
MLDLAGEILKLGTEIRSLLREVGAQFHGGEVLSARPA